MSNEWRSLLRGWILKPSPKIFLLLLFVALSHNNHLSPFLLNDFQVTRLEIACLVISYIQGLMLGL